MEIIPVSKFKSESLLIWEYFSTFSFTLSAPERIALDDMYLFTVFFEIFVPEYFQISMKDFVEVS